MTGPGFSLPVRIGAILLCPVLFVPVLVVIVGMFLAGGLWLWVTGKDAVDEFGRVRL